MPKIRIDDRVLDVAEGLTILEAASASGIDIPHFCFHPAFEPEGNCRMCLVEIEGSPKLELACATKTKEGMNIWSRNPKIDAARKDVLEMLLAEHPLDCPICDKAGDCKLQDYYERYGRFQGRFREFKEKRGKVVSLGKNLILDQERCVLCRRCVRFLRQIAGRGELGVFQRGIRTEIGLYEGRGIDNNYSGNLAEICPVGALTDKDFRFRTRAWLMEKGESLCPHCGRGCGVILEFCPGKDTCGQTREVFRIRTRFNPDVNGHWICDVGRYDYSYLDRERSGLVMMNKGETQTRLSWEKALIVLSEKIKSARRSHGESRLGLILSSFLSNEELFLIQYLLIHDRGLQKIWFADPKPGEADGFLLTAERSPNLRGAHELGYEPKPPDLENLRHGVDVLLIFGNGILDHFSIEKIRSAWEQIPAKFLFSAHKGDLDNAVDFILPTAVIAEDSGSLTNVEGKIQTFHPVWAAPQEARPGWTILRDLAEELSAGQPWMNSPQTIYQVLTHEYPFFRNGRG